MSFLFRKSGLAVWLSLVVLSLVGAVRAQAQATTSPPDTIFFDGNILTGTRLKAGDNDPTPGRVTAVAIRAGKIVAVGSDKEILALKGGHTSTIDLDGAFAMPGFNDAHTNIGQAVIGQAGQQRPPVGQPQQVPPPSLEMRRKKLESAIQDALAHGVTSIQDFSTWDDWLAMEELEDEGKLPLRISEWIDFKLPLGVLRERRASHRADDPLLHLGMLEGSIDGSLKSRTAAMHAGYTDDPNDFGIPHFEQGKLNLMAAERAADGFQLGFEAVGDLANDMALDALDAAEQVGRPANVPGPPGNPDASIVTGAPVAVKPSDFRFRVEDAGVVSPGGFKRFAQLGVIASVQPSRLLTDMGTAEQRLGPERSKRAYAWRSFLDHGVTLAFGTDYPAESISPFRGLYAAITRQNETGTQTFEPQEKLTIQQAIYAYTQGSAFAEFREKVEGRLEPGYFADIVVLDRDITKVSPQDVLHAKILRTVVGGKTVYLAR